MDLREIQELLVKVPEELAEDNLMEMSASEPMPEDEEEVRSIQKTNCHQTIRYKYFDYSRQL